MAQVLAAAPTPAPADARAELNNRLQRWIFILFGTVIVTMILTTQVPALAVILGVGIMAVVCFYLAKDVVRTRVDRLLGRQGAKRWVGTSLAVLAGGWACLMLFGFGLYVATGGIERAKAETVARAAADREEGVRQRIAELAAQTRAADEKLKEAESAAAKGEFEEARRLADQVHADMPMHPGTEGVLQKVSEGVQQRLIAALPEKLKEIAAKASAEQWGEAGVLCDEVEQVAAEQAELVALCAQVGAQLRKSAVGGWIFEAREVAAQECDTPKSIADAWNNLRKVQKGEEGYAAATKVAAALEKCRKKAEKTLDAGVRDVMIAQRERRAIDFEAVMLDGGVDMSVTLKGKYKDHMRISWVLIGRAAVHQMTKDGELLAGLQEIGFKRVTFTDGYYESYVYDLDPTSEDGGGKIALAGLGLDKAIKMGG